MNTHDVLAFAIAQEAIRRVSMGSAPWNSVLSATSYITSSRSWPVPDFVLVDPVRNVTVGAEFKPPRQSKREYLTGLGQAMAYTRDFHYGLLVLPTIADDGYPIGQHVASVLEQPAFGHAPLGLLTYDARTLAPGSPSFDEARFFAPRGVPPASPAILDQSFYAKWREISPQEIFQLLSFSYDEQRITSSATGTIRDRAFGQLWNAIQAKTVDGWRGRVRKYSTSLRTAVAKNYRNFLFHISWTESDGALTRGGLEALHTATLYGPESQPFIDTIARAVLLEGKHLILFNAIADFQDAMIIVDEQDWLRRMENYLEDSGLLKRNPARHGAAVAQSARQFLKAEKQLWRELGLIMPRGRRVFHPGRGFIFNWARITNLVQN